MGTSAYCAGGVNVVEPLNDRTHPAQSPSESPPVGFGRAALICVLLDAFPCTGIPSSVINPGTAVGVGVGTPVEVGVGVGVTVGVADGLGVGVGVTVAVAVGVTVGVADGVGVGLAVVTELQVPEKVSSTVPSDCTKEAS